MKVKEFKKEYSDKIVEEKSGVTLKGVYKFTKCKILTPKQWKMHDRIVELEKAGKPILDLVRLFNEMCKKEVFYAENLIPTVGRTLLANNLTDSSPDNNPRINYTALGTSDTAPANGQTTLIAEVHRKLTASSTNSSNIAYVTAFYTATEDTGTYKEAGLFCAGTSSADTGVLFSRVLLNGGTGIAKTSTETLTIDYTITIS